jgi:hypothetical protein
MSTHHIPALLLAQAVYAVVGAGYHLFSIRETRAGRRPLHAASGSARLWVMVAYGASLTLGLAGFDLAYRMAMAVSIVVIGYGGLLVHLPHRSSYEYRSWAAWATTIGIGIVGLILNIAGLIAGPRFSV